MSKSTRQLAVLGALLAVLAVVLVFRGGGAEPQTAAAPQAAVERAAPPRAIPVTGLRLDRLAANEQELGPVERDPFRFEARPEPVTRAPEVVRRPDPVPVVMAPTGPPPPPPIPLKFIGVLDAPARIGRLAVLSDSRGGVFYGKEGDTIEGRYRVLKVSDETAELSYLDGRGRQTIRLSGQ